MPEESELEFHYSYDGLWQVGLVVLLVVTVPIVAIILMRRRRR